MKKIAFLFSKAFFWGFTLFAFFVLLFSLLSFLEFYFNWDIPFVEFSTLNNKNYSTIKIPFIELKVKFLFSFTVIGMWFTFIFYSIYFYALQNFFAVFIIEKTFEEKSIKKLSTFFKLNLTPILIGFVVIFIDYFYSKKVSFDEAHFFVATHLIVTFFLYFYLDLIRKGNNIQQENDLTI